MSYWNKILLDQMFSKTKKRYVKYKLNTHIGRFYFYFKKEEGSEIKISGKLIFFPDLKIHEINKS